MISMAATIFLMMFHVQWWKIVHVDYLIPIIHLKLLVI
jgi:hypothetical protein